MMIVNEIKHALKPNVGIRACTSLAEWTLIAGLKTTKQDVIVKKVTEEILTKDVNLTNVSEIEIVLLPWHVLTWSAVIPAIVREMLIVMLKIILPPARACLAMKVTRTKGDVLKVSVENVKHQTFISFPRSSHPPSGYRLQSRQRLPFFAGMFRQNLPKSVCCNLTMCTKCRMPCLQHFAL